MVICLLQICNNYFIMDSKSINKITWIFIDLIPLFLSEHHKLVFAERSRRRSWAALKCTPWYLVSICTRDLLYLLYSKVFYQIKCHLALPMVHFQYRMTCWRVAFWFPKCLCQNDRISRCVHSAAMDLFLVSIFDTQNTINTFLLKMPENLEKHNPRLTYKMPL